MANRSRDSAMNFASRQTRFSSGGRSFARNGSRLAPPPAISPRLHSVPSRPAPSPVSFCQILSSSLPHRCNRYKRRSSENKKTRLAMVGVVFYRALSSVNCSDSSPGLDEEASTRCPGLKPAFSSHCPLNRIRGLILWQAKSPMASIFRLRVLAFTTSPRLPGAEFPECSPPPSAPAPPRGR